MQSCSDVSGLPVGSSKVVLAQCSLCPSKLNLRYHDMVRGTSYTCQCTVVLDKTTLDRIHSEASAYMLGHLTGLVKFDVQTIKAVIAHVWPGLPLYRQRASEEMVQAFEKACSHHLSRPSFLEELPQNIALAYVRGLYESVAWPGYATVCHGFTSGAQSLQLNQNLTHTLPEHGTYAGLTCNHPEIVSAIRRLVPLPTCEKFSTDKVLVWRGHNALDFLHLLYKDAKHYRVNTWYLTWCRASLDDSVEAPMFGVALDTSRGAVLPSKARASDSGYDLTIINRVKDIGHQTTLYDTGVRVLPPRGYYFDVVPRSSLSKTGHMLANSVGVIDASYSGNILIAVTKVDASMPDLVLPFCGFQLIPRRIEHFQVVEIGADFLEKTARGDGGFGSTGPLTLRDVRP